MPPRPAPRSTGNTPVGGPGRDMRYINPGMDTSRIADMYRQRIPTGPVPVARPATPVRPTGPTVPTTRISDRVGPRGTTIEDVARVAAGQQPARPAQQWPVEPSAPPPLDQRKVLQSMIGGPLATAGEKYGGFPTAAQAEAFIRGEAYNTLLAGQMAAEEAARLAQPIEEQFAYDIDPTRGGVAGKKVAENKQIMRQPVTDYASAMARMNAARGASEGGALANAEAMVTPALQAQRERGLQTSGSARQQELADLIGGLTPSELMQQFAVQRLGYDPALAAGLFPVSEDAAYEKMLTDAYNARILRETGIDPTANEAEMVLAQYGPEGLAQYQAQQAEYALYGTPTQQLSAEKNEMDAENALFDESIRQQYNFDPKTATDVDVDYVRDMVLRPEFKEVYKKAMEDLNADGSNAPDLAAAAAQAYRQKTGDELGARAIGQIIASFDLSYFE